MEGPDFKAYLILQSDCLKNLFFINACLMIAAYSNTAY